jgi:hypothetical protein
MGAVEFSLDPRGIVRRIGPFGLPAMVGRQRRPFEFGQFGHMGRLAHIDPDEAAPFPRGIGDLFDLVLEG